MKAKWVRPHGSDRRRRRARKLVGGLGVVCDVEVQQRGAEECRASKRPSNPGTDWNTKKNNIGSETGKPTHKHTHTHIFIIIY
jgi:hypothetical protein